ncbi:MAG: Ribosomal RNA methyltransferase RrmJ/FtsJ [uncultured bacterium]|nr:MAG: Ribosomal RNA methyltransferase RrmJ/FtsJ [uncultured bacterium]OFW67911.1 MAG: rRNA methyltransferase [Alphaproteobacteria bacterium GWC2_42_16]OFW73746.1 MAG: rRNA methyltransferase [Alphaproteobacteria bacterium GWA2_41_27]OFW82156.1 MAG: rRNA methyltransferase [Alphaproteobacteria bacterium RIFCSPHIGHO2_12_FULL_42_100]OFW85187.1 MAG: rRNA methyltransferase [Alphaproteobacteria bacterium RBG_16_42_14]OFW91339.1 MAG: rRNA methyltransferase [Alphaproteobacteria bacterium RIFCSPHIGHO2_
MKNKKNSGRALAVRLKTARGRKISSQRWLTRHLNDPYVQRAKEKGYRSRAAYKLQEIDDKFKILKRGTRVVDLGASPGGWLQVALERVGAQGKVVGIDLTPIEPLPGVHFICGDFTDPLVLKTLKEALNGRVDVVLSDMAAPSTGHSQTDHIRIMALAEEAFLFAQDVLEKDGSFVIKVLRGGTETNLLNLMKKHFAKVTHFKPPASRRDSAEIYVVALGFRP